MQQDYALLVQQICEAHQGGESVPSIATRLSVPAAKVRYALRRGGVELRRHAHNAVYVDEGELRRILDEAVLSIEQTAGHFGVSIPTISRRMRALGLKSKKGHGSPMEKNYFWNGGRMTDADGYILLKRPDHPNCNNNGYVREHRLVVEGILGRILDRTEVVHHIDGDKKNNSPENLEVFQTNAEHLRHELTGKTPNYTPAGLQKMRETALRTNRLRALSIQHKKGTGGASSP